jgi:hypothetical protein
MNLITKILLTLILGFFLNTNQLFSKNNQQNWHEIENQLAIEINKKPLNALAFYNYGVALAKNE